MSSCAADAKQRERERDRLPRYGRMKSRKVHSISIKFNIGQFYENVPNNFNFHLDWAVLTSSLRKIINISQPVWHSYEKAALIDFLTYLGKHEKQVA